MLKYVVASALSCVSLGALASAPQTAETIPDTMRDDLHIPHDYQVGFRGPDGKPISYARFQAEMATRPFAVDKNPVGQKATLVLLSDAEIAEQKAERAHPKPLPAQGHAFPSFQAKTLDGTPISTASLRGKPFVASFFFAQCAPCIAETPVLSAFHREHPDVAVVAFTFDDADTARGFVKERGLTWPVVSDQQALADQAQVHTYPTLMLVDAQGVVAKAAATIAPAGKQLDVATLADWVGTPH